nr:MAG TPA: hypothetical protein [Caudoviricetes sp.]
MYKKTITYTDFDGVERTETFLFNFTKEQTMKLQNSVAGGLDERIKKLNVATDNVEIYNLFRSIVLDAYGEKSEDGRHFYKSDEIRSEFESTKAFSEIVWSLIDGGEKAMAEFIEQVVPNATSQNA